MTDYHYLPEDKREKAERIEKRLDELSEQRKQLAQRERDLLDELSELVDRHLEPGEEVPAQ